MCRLYSSAINVGRRHPNSQTRARSYHTNVVELLAAIPPSRRETVEKFLSEVLSWGDVEARRGTSRKSKDGKTRYIRLHRHGLGYGAFAYVRPHRPKVTLRVKKEAAQGKKYVNVRNVKPRNAYQAKIYLKLQEACQEALALTRIAHDALPD